MAVKIGDLSAMKSSLAIDRGLVFAGPEVERPYRIIGRPFVISVH